MVAAVEQMFWRMRNGEPWHGLGYKLDDRKVSISEALTLSGLDFEIEKQELFTADGKKAPCYANVRTDKNLILGYSGEKYVPLQNLDAFKWFEPFIESGECDWDTAGSLGCGEDVWILAEIKRDPIELTPEDIVKKYILLSNNHSGLRAARCGFTPQRVVCKNTLAMAHNSEASALIRVRHSGSVLKNLEDIREVMNTVDQSFTATAEQYKRLLNKHISRVDVARYVCEVFEYVDSEGKISTRAANELQIIMDLVEKGVGNDLNGIRGTVWQAYNGVNLAMNYLSTRSESNRMSSLWFGENFNRNKKALDLAIQLSA